MSEVQTSNLSAQDNPLWNTVDAVTRARVGSLSAHGVLEQQIADILLLTVEQVFAVKNSDEFKKKYAEVADEQISRQLDLAEGWDAVEERALRGIIETLDFNRDPKYLLIAAKTANSAQRRKITQQPKVIGEGGPGVTNNVIILNLNKSYVTGAQKSETSATIDITPKQLPVQRRISDLPSPKSVDDLLSPVKVNSKSKLLSDIEEQFAVAGVVFDSDDDE